MKNMFDIIFYTNILCNSIIPCCHYKIIFTYSISFYSTVIPGPCEAEVMKNDTVNVFGLATYSSEYYRNLW